jgi:hypothetical protein
MICDVTGLPSRGCGLKRWLGPMLARVVGGVRNMVWGTRTSALGAGPDSELAPARAPGSTSHAAEWGVGLGHYVCVDGFVVPASGPAEQIGLSVSERSGPEGDRAPFIECGPSSGGLAGYL